MYKISSDIFKERLSWSLDKKIQETRIRIREWYEAFDGMVYAAYSGGLDSTVLLHVIRSIYPDVPAVFVNTGMEYPENIKLVKSTENLIVLRPKIPFYKIIEKYGYPIVSKKVSRFVSDLQNSTSKNVATRNLRLTGYNKKGQLCPSMKLSNKWHYLIDSPFRISDKCCSIIKEAPINLYAKKYGRYGYNGMRASESERREASYKKMGCNAFDIKQPRSMPLAFWASQDILNYIVLNGIKYSSVYGDIIKVGSTLKTTGVKRTGCMYCGFGVHLEYKHTGTNRFLLMQKTHPKHWDFCINKLGIGKKLDFIGVPYDNMNRKKMTKLSDKH